MGTTSSAVSVIIPTFNRAAMLSTTLESFAARSIAKNRYGVVVVDDGIADRRLLEEHLKAHKQYPQESVAILGYTTWAPTLSVTPLMNCEIVRHAHGKMWEFHLKLAFNFIP
jgi:glycosyltransferase involved in cell wall biosynthesis